MADDHPLDRRFDRFIDVGVDQGIADVGLGEDHDLVMVDRVGDDFLVPRHRGVKDHLAKGNGRGAKPLSLKHRPVLQD